jgi:hypothetical protein
MTLHVTFICVYREYDHEEWKGRGRKGGGRRELKEEEKATIHVHDMYVLSTCNFIA